MAISTVMANTTIKTDTFFELIRVALGRQSRLSQRLSESEWKGMLKLMRNQSVIGICAYAIDRLPTEQQPSADLLKECRRSAIGISQINHFMDLYSARVWNKLKDDGLDAAILKGQGLAPYYGELASYRQTGDIDVWVKGGFDKVNAYVQSTYPAEVTDYHHFHYPMFRKENIEVELHHRPVLMRNPFDNSRLQHWCEGFGKDTFIYLDEKHFAIPSTDFNRIFLVVHAYKHFIFDGIGIRQVMDCYQLLTHTNPGKNEMQIFRNLHLLPFLRALMWVFAYVFEGVKFSDTSNGGYPWMLCEPDEKEGRFLLEEITQTGNFSKHDSRFHFKHFSKLRFQIHHGIHILTHYPSEILWIPLWLPWHQCWKLSKKLKKE